MLKKLVLCIVFACAGATQAASFEKNNQTSIAQLEDAVSKGQLDAVTQLLSTGIDVNTGDIFGITPLHVAAQNGNVAVAQALLSCGANANAVDNSGITPLHLAIINRQSAMFKLLYRKVHTYTDHIDHLDPLCIACQRGDVETAKLLIKHGADPRGSNTNVYSSPLKQAIHSGNLELVAYLLAQGAGRGIDTNTRSLFVRDAMNHGCYKIAELLLDCPTISYEGKKWVIKKSDFASMVHLLQKTSQSQTLYEKCYSIIEQIVSANFDVNQLYLFGLTPLHLVAQEGDVKLAKLLLEKGADREAQDTSGMTPLDVAIVRQNHDMIQFLLALTYDIKGSDSKNDPLQMAYDKKDYSMAMQLLKYYNAINHLIYGYTPLHIASQNGHLEAVQLLLDRGALVENGTNAGNENALHLAVTGGHLKVVQLLLDRGASIDASNFYGSTALHMAASSGYIEIIQLLIDRGAHIEARDSATRHTSGGRTPLHYACESQKLDAIRVLLQNNANYSVMNDDNRTPLEYIHNIRDKECLLKFTWGKIQK